LLAEKDGQTYYIVAKGCYHAYRIQTEIGHLDNYQFLVKSERGKYLLIYPGEFKNHVDPSGEFSDYAACLFENRIEIRGI
jgi:hypothetical protein